MNELYQHKKSDSIKWIITFVAIILLAASVVALGAQVFGDGFNFSTSVEEEAPENNTENPSTNPVEPLEPIEAPTVSTMSIKNSDKMKLAAQAPTAYANKNNKSVELVATAYPLGSENGGFVWSATWANPNSTFAKGKDVYDYISFEGADGGNTLTVTSLQAFGEQIIITVSTEFNPDAKATCTIDYSQKFGDTQYINTYSTNFFNSTQLENNVDHIVKPIITGSKEQLIDTYYNDDNIEFSYITTDIYTMDMCDDDYYFVVTVAEEFYDALASVGIELEEWHSFVFNYSQDITPADVLNSLCCGKIIPTKATDVVDYELINKFNEAITLWDDYAIYIEVHAVSEFEEKVFFYSCTFDSSLVESISTSVELNMGSIVF